MREWHIGGSQIRWGAIFAGFVVGLSVQMMLTLLGLAIGAWSIDLRESQPTQGIPLGTGIWTGISMLISAFIGGYVTSRLSGAPLRSDGIYHGAVVWGVTWLIFAWLATTAMATMIGGLFSAFGAGLHALGQTAGQGVSTAVSKVAEKSTGIANVSAEGLRRQIESVLRATQKPELQPGEMKKDTAKVANKAHSGQPLSQVTDAGVAELQGKLAALDREAAVNVMVNKFGMSKAQAEEVVQSTIGMMEPLKAKAQEVKEQSVDMANATIKNLASAAWWMFLLAIFSLLASLGGGAFGVSDNAMLEVEGLARARKLTLARNRIQQLIKER